MEYIIFKLDNENYTIPLEKIKEILVYSQIIITDLFNESESIRGLMNLRGEVIPIIDLRIHFGIGSATFDQNSVVIVIKTNSNKLMGIIVDNIDSILQIDKSKAIQAPDMGVSIDPRFIEGLIKLNDEQMTTLLDIDKVLSLKEIEML